MQKLNGIHILQKSTVDDWTSVDALVDACREHDALEAPLHRMPASNEREVNQFLYYEHGILVGIATLQPGTDIEVLGMVHPRHRRSGIAGKLLSAVAGECRGRGVSNYLIVCETASSSGCAFAEGVGAEYEFSEHLMELNCPEFTDPGHNHQIQLSPASSNDVDDLVDIQPGANDSEYQSRRTIESWLDSSAHRILVARISGTAVGMIRITEMDDAIWLTSFFVRKAIRRKGVGRQILEAVIRELEWRNTVLLEVETDNKNAIALYRSVGFRERTTYRYYRQVVD